MKPRVFLRQPSLADMKPFLAAVRESEDLHRPWVAAPNTPARFRAFLKKMQPPTHYIFLVCRREDQAVAGVINLSNIVRGLFQSGYLSYYAFAGHERQGYLREGLQAVIRHAFKVLKLHRLEANIQPGNTASIALVKSCDFRKEGYSPRYLKIGGRWRDHERWAILRS